MMTSDNGRSRRRHGFLVAGALGAGALSCTAPLATSVAAATAAATAGGARSTGATCSHPVITTFAFSPKTVVEGKSATLEAAVANCTAKKFSGSLEIYGKLVCLVLDPVRTKITLVPGSALASLSPYRAPACTGSASLTGVLLTAKGKAISTKVARLNVVAPPPS